jgi:hypothetical protein
MNNSRAGLDINRFYDLSIVRIFFFISSVVVLFVSIYDFLQHELFISYVPFEDTDATAI